MNLKDLSDDQLNVHLAKTRFHLNDEDISAFNFCFWFIFYYERQLGTVLENLMNTDESRKDLIRTVVEELDFRGKMNAFKKLPGDHKMIDKFTAKIYAFRNNLFHNKVDATGLVYDNLLIKERATREKMIVDLFESIKNYGG